MNLYIGKEFQLRGTMQPTVLEIPVEEMSDEMIRIRENQDRFRGLYGPVSSSVVDHLMLVAHKAHPLGSRASIGAKIWSLAEQAFRRGKYNHKWSDSDGNRQYKFKLGYHVDETASVDRVNRLYARINGDPGQKSGVEVQIDLSNHQISSVLMKYTHHYNEHQHLFSSGAVYQYDVPRYFNNNGLLTELVTLYAKPHIESPTKEDFILENSLEFILKGDPQLLLRTNVRSYGSFPESAGLSVEFVYDPDADVLPVSGLVNNSSKHIRFYTRPYHGYPKPIDQLTPGEYVLLLSKTLSLIAK